MPNPTESPADVLRRATTRLRRQIESVDLAKADRIGRTHLADLLDHLATEMDDYPAVFKPDGVGIESMDKPDPAWTSALAVARSMLAEAS